MEHVELIELLKIGTVTEDVSLFRRVESDMFTGEQIKESYEVVGFKDNQVFGFYDLTKSQAIVTYDVLSCEILSKYNEKRLATYAAMN